MRPVVLLLLCLLAAPAAAQSPSSPYRQTIHFSRYRLVGDDGPLGYTDYTEFRRADGSRSYLARERMEFWGPVLERFVVLNFHADGRFDSGHWVGTSAYAPFYSYTFRHDGRAIRGDWEGTVVGKGWTEVPSPADAPLMGFWGPLESLLMDRFDRGGPDVQTFDAVDVEDSHHRRMTVTARRLGREDVEVPAGSFLATKFRSERFGATHHWFDEDGVLLRWSSENDAYRWDLERAPSTEPLERLGEVTRSGIYELTPGPANEGGPRGRVLWRLSLQPDGDFWLHAEERLDRRQARLAASLDDRFRWRGSTETVDWKVPEGEGSPEIHHFETFFYRDKLHLLRFRDRAHTVLQTRDVRSPVPFHLVNYPITAMFWLRHVRREPGEQLLPELAHIGNRYRGALLEVQRASVRYLGRAEVEGPRGTVSGHHFEMRYPGGWVDSTFEYWTDDAFVPLRLKLSAGEGDLEYRLVELLVQDEVFSNR